MKQQDHGEHPLPCGGIGAATARYLLALLDLGRGERTPTQVALSRTLGVTPASIFEMVRRLRERGLVCEEGLELTQEGMSTALVLASRRDAARRWTHEVLGLEKSAARAEGEHLALSGAAGLGRSLTAWRRSTQG